MDHDFVPCSSKKLCVIMRPPVLTTARLLLCLAQCPCPADTAYPECTVPEDIPVRRHRRGTPAPWQCLLKHLRRRDKAYRAGWRIGFPLQRHTNGSTPRFSCWKVYGCHPAHGVCNNRFTGADTGRTTRAALHGDGVPPACV